MNISLITNGIQALLSGTMFLNYFDLVDRFDSSSNSTVIVSSFASIYSFNEFGLQPLHYAVQKNRFGAVQVLINKFGADVNCATTHHGYTPLILAIQQNNIQIFDFLLSNPEIDINLTLLNFESPVHFAVYAGSLYMVDALIKRGATVTFCRNTRQSPFHIAISTGYIEIARYLAEKKFGISVICVNNVLENCIQYLARQRHSIETTVILLNLIISAMKPSTDSKRSAVDHYIVGKSPLSIALELQNENMIFTLLAYGANFRSVPSSLANNFIIEVLKSFYSHSESSVTSLDKFDSEGNSIWHIAALHNAKSFIHALSSRFPDMKNILTPNNYLGQTPIEISIQNSHLETSRYLIDIISKQSMPKDVLIRSIILSMKNHCDFPIFEKLIFNYEPSLESLTAISGCSMILHLIASIVDDSNQDHWRSIIRILLTTYPELYSSRDTQDRSPIQLAESCGNSNFIIILNDYLLNSNVNCDKEDKTM